LELIKSYFSDLTEHQIDQFDQLWKLYHDWNEKINVISRKDIDNLYVNHVLHSLSIAKYISFVDGTRILDLGTGGGFPGIPLAILFPQVQFTLFDGIGKKIKVCNEVITALNLQNAHAFQKRAEESKEKHHFVVTRAVAKIDKLIEWSRKLISNQQKNRVPNGLIALKGGDIEEEMLLLPKWEYHEVVPISMYFQEKAFDEKYLVYVQG
jgi:16S rRNA (guanine527-N7)-methyltransferase